MSRGAKLPAIAVHVLSEALGAMDEEASRYHAMKAETAGRHAEERRKRQEVQHLCQTILDRNGSMFTVHSLAQRIVDICSS